jgi:hypothetical protein
MSEPVDHVPTLADAETHSFDEDVAPEALNLSATIFWIFALIALAVLPWAIEKGRRDLGWVQEPWSWPFIALSIGLLGGAIQPVRLWVLSKRSGFGAAARNAFDGMGAALVYAVAFLVYLGGISVLGFTIASAIFMQALYWMSGLRGGKWPWIAFLVTLGFVLAFRVGLDIWFPTPPILQLFPDQVAGAIGGYL